jgi:hypothetical protein
MKNISKLGGFGGCIQSGGAAPRCPVQSEKTKPVLAESAIYFFSVSFFKPRTPPPPILVGSLRSPTRIGGGGVLGTGFDLWYNSAESPTTAMSNLAAWSGKKFTVSIHELTGSIPHAAPQSGRTTRAPPPSPPSPGAARGHHTHVREQPPAGLENLRRRRRFFFLLAGHERSAPIVPPLSPSRVCQVTAARRARKCPPEAFFFFLLAGCDVPNVCR